MRARRPGRSLFVRRFGLRTSLAGRLLAGGIVFTALLIAGVSGFLLVSRSQQTDAGALSNADNRAGVAAELISRVVHPQAAVRRDGGRCADIAADGVEQQQPERACRHRVHPEADREPAGLGVAILDSRGAVVYTSECDRAGEGGATTHPATSACEQGAIPHVTNSLASVRDALQVAANAACRQSSATIAASPALLAQCPPGIEGVEMLAGGLPALDVAVPVFNVQAGTNAPLGVVVYSAPLQTQFARYGPVIGYTPVFLRASSGSGTTFIRFTSQAATPTPSVAPPAITQQVAHPLSLSGVAVAHAIYTVAGVGAVAGSFVPLEAPGATAIAGLPRRRGAGVDLRRRNRAG